MRAEMTMPAPIDLLRRARALVAEARRIVVLTGAGVSAESGIPVFRGAVGLWRNFSPVDLATPAAFERDPLLVWEWYDWRRGLIAKASPNPAHEALARLEARVRGGPRGGEFTLVTQNVDGLHALAGSRSVLELHGSIWTLRCTSCGAEREDRSAPLAPLPPRCACGGLERPGVVWFGESLSRAVMNAAADASSSCDLFLMIGTSAVVWPAAGLGEIALGAGAAMVEINPEATEFSDRVLSLRGKAGEILPGLLD